MFLGYSFPSDLLKISVKAAMRLRALALRKITFKKYPSFVTTEFNRTYPGDTELNNWVLQVSYTSSNKFILYARLKIFVFIHFPVNVI